MCVARLRWHATVAPGAGDDAAAVGGSALGGIMLLARSRYLLGICAFMAIATTPSTIPSSTAAATP